MSISVEDHAELIIACQDNREQFFEYLFIKTKDRQVIPLRANEAQRRLIAEVEKQERAGKPIRGIIVKPRQVGFTTIIQALFFHASSLFENTNALTVAHDLDSSVEIFGMDRLFLDKLPPFLRPMTRFSNRKEVVFENPNTDSRIKEPGMRSQIRVATANDEELGRSKTIHLLHRSERAFWANQADTLLAVSQAVPDLPSTMIFDESTPNGVGDQFHRDYKAAKEGETAFFPFFMAWFEHDEYATPLDISESDFEDSLDSEEAKLKSAYGLSLEQLNWRRWAIANKCGRDPEKFRQEYPSNDVDCFLLSGRSVFDSKMLQRLLLQATDPRFTGNLQATANNPLHTKLQENSHGYIRMWQPPVLGRRYVIGADVAEGLEHGDYSCAAVHDWETFELLAEWHGHIEPDLFADELAMLGNLYNTALIGCEDNNHGGTTNRALKRMGYQNVFYRKETDDRGIRKTEKLGWSTTAMSKPVMIDSLAQLCRDGARLPNKELIEEMLSFVRDDKGKMNAQSGCFDDRVIASAIAAEIRKFVGIERIFPGLARGRAA